MNWIRYSIGNTRAVNTMPLSIGAPLVHASGRGLIIAALKAIAQQGPRMALTTAGDVTSRLAASASKGARMILDTITVVPRES